MNITIDDIETTANLHSITECARRLEVDRMVMSRKIKNAGMVPQSIDPNTGGKLYDIDQVRVLLSEDSAAAQGEDALKNRKLMAEAEKIEITVQKLRGKLVPIDEVRGRLYEFIKLMHQSLVVEFPRSVGPVLAGMDNQRDIVELLRTEMTQLIEDFGRSAIFSDEEREITDAETDDGGRENAIDQK